MQAFSLQLGDFSVQTEGWPESALWPVLQRLYANPMTTGAAQTEALLVLSEQALTARDFPVALLAQSLAAQAAYEDEQNERAHALATSALEAVRQIGDEALEAQLYKLLAILAFEDGRSKDGHDHLLDAMALFDDLAIVDSAKAGESALLTRWYGEHLAILGAQPEAQLALQKAREKFLKLGDSDAARGCDADLEALRQRGL